MIKRMNHININCRDFDTQLAFYRDVLGCSTIVSGGRPDSGAVFEEMGSIGPRGARTEVLCIGGEQRGPYIELIQWAADGADKIAGPRDIGMARIGFVVDDVDAVYEEMCRSGVNVRTSPHGGGVGDSNVRAFFFEDPEGNLLEALQFAGRGNSK
jgi:catechol 2,3-dioxygenase-like lactoylglutathione lyase family enzyme